ncbi:MAG: hypothetical protein ACXVSJ_16710 [Solirubrobacteraceae bacterium]
MTRWRVPLRGVSIDSAYIASFIVQIPGSVLAVGHSYRGAVISTAATDAANVVGLVFVVAFAPEEGPGSAGAAAGTRSRTWRPQDPDAASAWPDAP